MEDLIVSRRVLDGVVIIRVANKDRTQVRNLTDQELKDLETVLKLAQANVLDQSAWVHVNGRRVPWTKDVISYSEVVEMIDPGSNRSDLTMTVWSPNKPGCHLMPGTVVNVTTGSSITAVRT